MQLFSKSTKKELLFALIAMETVYCWLQRVQWLHRRYVKKLITNSNEKKSLGADIIIPLDELPPYHVSEDALIKSFERTHRWEERSINQHLKNVNKQVLKFFMFCIHVFKAMYSVIHGGVNKELRDCLNIHTFECSICGYRNKAWCINISMRCMNSSNSSFAFSWLMQNFEAKKRLYLG